MRHQTLTRLQLEVLAESQDNRCIYCGDLFTFLRPPCADHFIPFSFCQSNHKDNFVAACKSCNSRKNGEYFESVEEVRRHLGVTWGGIWTQLEFPFMEDLVSFRPDPPNRFCAYCNSAFHARIKTKVFCSIRCSFSAAKEKYLPSKVVLQKICERCGTAFTSTWRQSKYCSDRCGREVWLEKGRKTCQ